MAPDYLWYDAKGSLMCSTSHQHSGCSDTFKYTPTCDRTSLQVGSPACKRVLTWLILPVVICLFQRLSHASLSISFYTAKLRIAHYNSYNLHDDHYLNGYPW